MLPNRFSLLYYLRKPNNYRTGKVPIYLSITVDSQRSKLSTQMSCEPARWSRHAGRLIGTKEEVRSLEVFRYYNIQMQALLGKDYAPVRWNAIALHWTTPAPLYTIQKWN